MRRTQRTLVVPGGAGPASSWGGRGRAVGGERTQGARTPTPYPGARGAAGQTVRIGRGQSSRVRVWRRLGGVTQGRWVGLFPRISEVLRDCGEALFGTGSSWSFDQGVRTGLWSGLLVWKPATEAGGGVRRVSRCEQRYASVERGFGNSAGPCEADSGEWRRDRAGAVERGGGEGDPGGGGVELESRTRPVRWRSVALAAGGEHRMALERGPGGRGVVGSLSLAGVPGGGFNRGGVHGVGVWLAVVADRAGLLRGRGNGGAWGYGVRGGRGGGAPAVSLGLTILRAGRRAADWRRRGPGAWEGGFG